MSSIRGVLFDVGGVLIRTPFEMIAGNDAIDVPWHGPFAPESDALFAAVGRGEISERNYWHQRSSEIAELIGEADAPAAMRAVFARPEADVVRPEMIELAEELEGAGLVTGILTNDLAKFHGDDWTHDLPSLTRFAVHVDLSHTDTLKPHPEAFRLGTEAMGLEPPEVLFVDDQPVNITGAARAGIKTLQFNVTDVPASVTEIRQAAGLAE